MANKFPQPDAAIYGILSFIVILLILLALHYG